MTTEEILVAMLAESEKRTRLLTTIHGDLLNIEKAVEKLGRQAAPSADEMRKRMEEVKGMLAGTPIEMIFRNVTGGKPDGK